MTLLRGSRPGRITLIVFRGRSRWPSIAVKVATKAEHFWALEREARSLKLVSRDLNDSIGASAPRHLGSLRTPKYSLLATTAVRGRRAELPSLTKSRSSRSDRHRLGRHIGGVRLWSRELRQAIPSNRQRTGLDVANRLHRYLEIETLPPLMAERLAEIAGEVGQITHKWNAQWQHGDVAPGNVLWFRGGVRLVDWEAASPYHDPWRDDAYLILSLARNIQNTSELGSSAALKLALDTESWVGRILASSYTEDWPHPLPIHRALVAVAVEHALMAHALKGSPNIWQEVVGTLVSDEEIRSSCDWLFRGVRSI